MSRFPSQPFLLIPVPPMLQPGYKTAAADGCIPGHGSSSSKYRDSRKETLSSVSQKDTTTR